MPNSLARRLRQWLSSGPGASSDLTPDRTCFDEWNAPELCEPDGLIDYAGDYSDEAARSLNKTTSRYRVGIGMLEDDEQARWEALGRKRSCRQP